MPTQPLTLAMKPLPGERLVRFVGDRLRFELRAANGAVPPDGWRAWLRTNLGRGPTWCAEILQARGGERPMSGASWRDVPMRREGSGWAVELALAEAGYFKAKAYAVDERGFQVWPDGPDFGLSVHPDRYRTGNTIYCAFTRLFGESRSRPGTTDTALDARLKRLDKLGYAVIPASGTFRDLIRQLPHIVETLGCRILQLLPINPTPTTYARMGRFGSPYAGLDFTGIDPALVEFDKRTTGVDQFRELAYAAHARGARLFLDLVINHTGWGSTLHETHPEWFVRNPDGTFQSPGAWGVTWEDLVDLDESHRDLWDVVAEAFLTWCRRGVDGFRCDAGYKIPMPVWRYVIARVRQEFPDTLFLLEGLGGAWHDTENLLTEGGMQWAYSELFQEYSGEQVGGYLDHALQQSLRAGLLVHYSETHDNDRLAAKGRAWSLLRNRLCALTSVSGAYGFTCGVEWLAAERIRVHGCTGLAWDNPENLVPELARLNRLLSDHPAFFDGAVLTRLSPPASPVLALRRNSTAGAHPVLALVNTDPAKRQSLTLGPDVASATPGGVLDPGSAVDLLSPAVPAIRRTPAGQVVIELEPGACHCLALSPPPSAGSGESYRQARARAAFGLQALADLLEPEDIGPHEWPALAARVDRDPQAFLAALSALDRAAARQDLIGALDAALAAAPFPQVVTWTCEDQRRITPVPPGHWLLVRDPRPFRVSLRCPGGHCARHAEGLAVSGGHVAAFPPPADGSPSPRGTERRPFAGDAELVIERYAETERDVRGTIRFLPPSAPVPGPWVPNRDPAGRVLLTNGRGAMARLAVDLGRIDSKYDCLLGANLNPEVPVDRHVFAKRVRVWALANGFLSPLNADNLAAFSAGPPARWTFRPHAGDGRTAEIVLNIDLIDGQNTAVLEFSRGTDQPVSAVDVRLTARVDIEDRNFHQETHRNGGADHHFSAHTRSLESPTGFHFAPTPDRQLRVFANPGAFHPQPEWCEAIPHPLEATRGQVTSGDAFSPGWFDLPLAAGSTARLVVTAEPAPDPELAAPPASEALPGSAGASSSRRFPLTPSADRSGPPAGTFEARLRQAARAFVVRRGRGRTVIAGYPWFLDWGRDTLICARGLVAAGMTDDVRQLLVTFGRFERDGTLPNSIHGEDASNRDTSDAPLWYGVVCEDLARTSEPALPGPATVRPDVPYSLAVDAAGRTVAEVLRSIALGYLRGTPNGVRVDPDSGLVWSPAHFTWMDTNHPAGTPREGYPIEIQALWIRLLRQLGRIGAAPETDPWEVLADRALDSMNRRFWLEDRGWFADVLLAKAGVPARDAAPSDALRSNALLPVSLGLVTADTARRCVEAARRHLVVPGALRSLAPLIVTPPLEVRAPDGRLLNNPARPYCGRYEGDEDTRRKVAYHNGTAWTWTLPAFCEALVRAWEASPAALAAARAYLGSLAPLLDQGCLGQIPEILDGDAPHAERGCDAQAWGVTEALRVWKQLGSG